MKSLIRFGLQRAVLMNLIFVGVVVFAAAVALPRLPIEVFPNMAFGEVMVFVDYPGAPPEDVERLVAEPIEDTVRGMDDIDFVRCDSHAGHCSVHVKFVDDTDYAALYDDLRIRVLGAQNRLPVVNGEHLTPQIIKVEVDAWLPVIQLNLLPDDERLDKRSLILLARELRNRIELIDGVKGSLMVGERPQQFELALDPRRLERHGVTFAAATAALRRDGTAVPAGILESVAGERHVRVDDRYRTRADLLAVVVRRDGDGNLITIGDLVVPQRSGVRDVPGKVKVSVNGRPAIGIQVHKHADTGAREVVAALREQVALFERAHADEGVSVVATMDSTIKIADSMQALGSSLHLALVWVMVALFLFLTRAPPRILLIGLAFGIGTSISGAVGTFALIDGLLLAGLALFIFAFCRAAVLTATGIVFSFLGTLAYLHITGMSINEVSLLGFVLTCGIIVDDAIVVLENIRRHREHGKPLHRSALDGAAEVFWPVVSATLTTCCAFLPLLLMTGVIGQFFAIIPITVAIALVVSLFECLLLLPLHAVELERLLGPERLPPPRAENTAAFLERPGPIGVLARVYDRLLRWNLAHRAAAVGIALLLFAAAVGVLMQSVYGPRIDPDTRPLLKMEFFPDNTAVVNVSVFAPSGTTLDQTDALVREICGQIMQRPRSEVATCTGMAGMVWDESYKERYSHQHGFIFVELPPRAQQRYDDALAFVAELRDDLQRRFAHGGIRIEVRPQRDGPPTGAKVNVRVTGLSDAAVEGLAMELYAWMRSEQDGALAGIADIEHDRDLYHDELAFHVDPAAAARFDLPPSQVREFVAGAFDGLWVGDYLRTDDEIPVRLRIDPEALRQPIAIANIPVVDDPGERVVRFGDLGQLAARQRPASLVRRDYQRMITITAGVAEASTQDAVHLTDRIDAWYRANAAQYPGATIAFGGETEATQKSYHSLIVAFGIAVFLIYAVLAVQFNSYLQPLLILSNIVFSFTGVILVMGLFSALFGWLPDGFIREQRFWFTMQSFIAIIGLTGLVVNDAIVLIDFINRRRAEGSDRREALLLAGHQRMRPIMMTTVTTIAGLLPMAIGIPEFSVQWSPFATCFIAGLSMSTIMTLLIVPVLYDLLIGAREHLVRSPTEPAEPHHA